MYSLAAWHNEPYLVAIQQRLDFTNPWPYKQAPQLGRKTAVVSVGDNTTPVMDCSSSRDWNQFVAKGTCENTLQD